LSRAQLGRDLKEGERSGDGSSVVGFRPVLVVGELAMALVLLVGAGLMISSLGRLLSVEAGFDAAQDAEMMEAYCGGAPSAALMGRMVIYKAMCDLLWTLWGLIQHANGNPADDFWAYAVNRFERCQKLMNAPAFAGHVAAVKAG